MEPNIDQAMRDAFAQVLSEVGFPAATLDGRDGESSSTEIVSMVGLAGSLSGYLILGFASGALSSVAKHFSDTFSMGQDGTDKAFMGETASELANQFGGRLGMILSPLGIDVNITPPTVMSGKNMAASFPQLSRHWHWEAATPVARFTISVLAKN